YRVVPVVSLAHGKVCEEHLAHHQWSKYGYHPHPLGETYRLGQLCQHHDLMIWLSRKVYDLNDPEGAEEIKHLEQFVYGCRGEREVQS
ncbi:unnamed protein product, partial [marine sediment metagenome]